MENNNSETDNDVNIIEKGIEFVDKTKDAYETSNNAPKNIEHVKEINQQIVEEISSEKVSEQNVNTYKDGANLVMEDKKLQIEYVENSIAEKVESCIEDNIIHNIIHQEKDTQEEKSAKDVGKVVEQLQEKYEMGEITNSIEGQTTNVVGNKVEDSDIIGSVSNINKEIVEGHKPVKENENIIDDAIEFVDKLKSVEGKEKIIETAVLPQYNSNTVNEESDKVKLTNNKTAVNTGKEFKVENADTEVKDVAIHTSKVKSESSTDIKDYETSKPLNQSIHYSVENTLQEILEKGDKSKDILLKKAEEDTHSSYNEVSKVNTNEDDTNVNMNSTSFDHDKLKETPHNNPKQEVIEVIVNAGFSESPSKENTINTYENDTNLDINSTSPNHDTIKENPHNNPKQEVLEVIVNADSSESPDRESKVNTNKYNTNDDMNTKSLDHETVKGYPDNIPKQEVLEVTVNSDSSNSLDRESKVDTDKDNTNVDMNRKSLDHETVTENFDNITTQEVLEVIMNTDSSQYQNRESTVDTNEDDTNEDMNSKSLNNETVKENPDNNLKQEVLEVIVDAVFQEPPDRESKVNTDNNDTNVNMTSASLHHEKVKESPDNNPNEEGLDVTVNSNLLQSQNKESTNNVSLMPGEDLKDIITHSNGIASGLVTKPSTVVETKSIMEDIHTDVNINPLMKHDKELESPKKIEIVHNDTEGEVLNESAKYNDDNHTENNEQLNDTHENSGNVPPKITLSDVNEVEIKHKDSNDVTGNIQRPTRDVSTEDDTTDASIGSNIESIENNGDTSEEIASNLNKSQAPMDLETAAVTIQKVFRSFLFKSRNSTIDDDGSNDMPFLASDENLMDDEEKPSDSESLLTSNKERRALSRMDTVLQTVNEEKSLSLSTDDSSTLSSAATTIQAHVRGFLVRNKFNSNKTNSTSSLLTSGDPGTSSELENEVRSKTVLNIHIVPEGAQFESTDNMSVDLPFDVSPRTSNLHPLGYDKSEPRKQLKREDAIQSVSPPSNNSGKLSEDRDSIKELPLNETKILPEVKNTSENEGRDNVDISVTNDTENSVDTTPTKSLTADTVIEVAKDFKEESTSPEMKIDIENKRNRLTKMSSDEMDVVTPYEDGSFEKLEGTKLMHSGEFHDAVLPTRVSRHEPSVVRGE